MPEDPSTSQADRRARAKAAFLESVVCLTAREAGELLSPGTRAPEAVAEAYRRRQEILALTAQGVVYPAFQFEAGAPKPVLARLISIFRDERGWALALWLNAPCGWLDGRRPLEVLDDNPDAVLSAARRTIRPLDT